MAYKNIYWLLDQRFDFLLPLFERYYGVERKQITFVGSYHGPVREGEAWKDVKKVLIGKNKLNGRLYITADTDQNNLFRGRAVWLEPEDINYVYARSIEVSPETIVVSFSGDNLPEGVESLTSIGGITTVLNNKWEQYMLLKRYNGKNTRLDSYERIHIPYTVHFNLNKFEKRARKRELCSFLEKQLSRESYFNDDCKRKKIVVKKANLSGGYRVKVISNQNDIESYCNQLEEVDLEGSFLVCEYIPHKRSYAGLGIVCKEGEKNDSRVICCGITEQVLYKEVAYEGLIWPAFWDDFSEISIVDRKKEAQRITEIVGEVLREYGYFGYYNVDFVEESITGKLYVVEVNARFGFSTILYALYCGDRFFDAIQGNDTLVMRDEEAGDKRILLGKIRGFKGLCYSGICNISDIKSWYENDDNACFKTIFTTGESFECGGFVGVFGEKISCLADYETALDKFMKVCLQR